jgi:hypothetical protein
MAAASGRWTHGCIARDGGMSVIPTGRDIAREFERGMLSVKPHKSCRACENPLPEFSERMGFPQRGIIEIDPQRMAKFEPEGESNSPESLPP